MITIVNPLTGRSIKIGGSLYVKLVKIGVIVEVDTPLKNSIDDSNEIAVVSHELPHEIIAEEIAIHFNLHTLRALCTTNVANRKVCYDFRFLLRWSHNHPEESSLMMEWIAARKEWSLMEKLMHDVVWDAKSKLLAVMYLLENYNGSLNKTFINVYAYLVTYADAKPTILKLGLRDINTFQSIKNNIKEVKTYSDYLKAYVKNSSGSKQFININKVPILYVGDFLLSEITDYYIQKLFSRDVTIYDNEFSLMMAIMATLSNEGRIKQIIEFFGLIRTNHTEIRRVITTYASKDTYIALKENVLKTSYLFENLKHRDLVLYLMEKHKDDSIFWDADPCAFSASEYVDLALKIPLKYFDVSVNENLLSTLYDLLVRGEEYRARELSAELKRRGMSYKYNWDNDDPLTVWDRAT